MKLPKITGCLLAGLVTASCSVKNQKLPIHRAQRLAKTYVKKSDDFTKITNNAPFVPESLSSGAINERIFYWDSIYAYEKMHSAIDSGRAYIIDSIAGKNVKYPEFKIEADTDNINYKQIIENIKKEISKYNTKEEMEQMLSKEPKPNQTSDELNKLTHYYGQIAIKSAEKKGFEWGAENQRYKELEKKLIEN